MLKGTNDMKRFWTRQIPKLLHGRSTKSVQVVLVPRTFLCDILHMSYLYSASRM